MTQSQPRKFSIPTAILWTAGLAVLTGMVGPVSSTGTDDGQDGPESREDRCRREVLDLHQFFQDWFNGSIEPTESNFARLADVLDKDFVLIGPEGGVAPRDPLVERLRGTHGAWTQEGGEPGRIWIENFRVRRAGEDMLVATYEEWQEVAGERKIRLSTVVFGERRGTPEGVSWLHLHEVWMPEPEASVDS